MGPELKLDLDTLIAHDFPQVLILCHTFIVRKNGRFKSSGKPVFNKFLVNFNDVVLLFQFLILVHSNHRRRSKLSPEQEKLLDEIRDHVTSTLYRAVDYKQSVTLTPEQEKMFNKIKQNVRESLLQLNPDASPDWAGIKLYFIFSLLKF